MVEKIWDFIIIIIVIATFTFSAVAIRNNSLYRGNRIWK